MSYFSRHVIALTVSFFLVATLSGCAPIMIGAAGIVGGYAISPDTVEGITPWSFTETWDASQEILSIMGAVEQKNEAFGQIYATVNGANVSVTLMSVNASSTKLTVKARKAFLPKIDLAQDIYTKIINHIEQ